MSRKANCYNEDVVVVAVVECKMTSEPLGEGAVTIMMIGMMNVEDTLIFSPPMMMTGFTVERAKRDSTDRYTTNDVE